MGRKRNTALRRSRSPEGDLLLAEQFAQYYSSLKGFARNSRLDRIDPLEDGDDLVQQTALGILESSQDPACINISYWMSGLRNRAITTYRRRTHSRAGQVALPEDDSHQYPKDHIEISAMNIDLLSALAQLPSRQRRAVILTHVLGFSSPEAANLMGTTTGTVYVTTSKGLSGLRNLLTQESSK